MNLSDKKQPKPIKDILEKEYQKDLETLTNGYVTREIGDTVFLDGFGMAQQNGGPVKVTNIDWKFDENTGRRYQIFEIDDSSWFDARDGSPYGSSGSMYYIDL